jgi:hypothetical protein
LLAVGVLGAYAVWRALDWSRHRLVIVEEGVGWQIDPVRLHAHVRPLRSTPNAGAARDYELRGLGSGVWQKRLTNASRQMMLDDSRRELLTASDKQRLEIREALEIALHEVEWGPVPQAVARALDAYHTGRPSGAGTELAART